MATPEDWLKSTTKQRQDLYRAARQLVRLGEFTWNDLYANALERAVSGSFDENFRKGRVSAADASRIYRFLQQRYPDAVRVLDAEAFTAKAFSDFLLRFRRLGMIQLLPELLGAPFRVGYLGHEWAEYPFETAEPVSFRLWLPLQYSVAFALNGCDTGWFPMTLCPPTDCELQDIAPIKFPREGPSMVQAVTQGHLTISTTEPTDAERRRRLGSNIFLFIFCDYETLVRVEHYWPPDQALANDELNRLANELGSMRPTWALAQINATGIGPRD